MIIRMEAQLNQLFSDIAEMKLDVKQIRRDHDEMRARVMQNSWRWGALVCTIGIIALVFQDTVKTLVTKVLFGGSG